jgi:flagellar biosynthesis/type III secretory pathway protein FliH
MQQDDLNQRLKEREMPEIIDWWRQEGIEIGMEKGRTQGMEEGIRTSNLENARKMREHGIAWEIVTDVTGIKPEDLE